MPRGWVKLKNKVLGQDYDLSLAFISPQVSQKLNAEWRGKNKPANILSFPLSPESGEILINRAIPETEGLYLFIHGLLHLKGERHGSRMEGEEQRLMNWFNINGKNNHLRS